MYEGGQKVPSWLLIVLGISMIPILALLYLATQPGRLPSWLLPTASISFLTPLTLLGLYLVVSMFRVKESRRALLEDLEFSPIDRDDLGDLETEFLTASHQRIVPIDAKLYHAWRGMQQGCELALYEFRYSSGNNRFFVFLASATVLPPPGQVCMKRSQLSSLSWIVPGQLKGIAPKRFHRKWLIYGDEESAQHFLSEPVCTFLDQLPPKLRLMFFWSDDKLFVGTTGSLTREGVEYLFDLVLQLKDVANISSDNERVRFE